MHWYPRYRFLLFIVLLTAVAMVWEVTDPNPEKTGEPESYSRVMLELYPDSTRIVFTKAMQGYMSGDLEESRRQFEKALTPKIKTDENLLYYYAMVLVRSGAADKEIDAAIAEWKRNFPHSVRADPRTAVKEGQLIYSGSPAKASDEK